jgi:type II secretory pathway pseudopilin PulG
MKDEKRRSVRSSASFHPSSFIPHPFFRSAFTMIEMLTTVAILIILLGLMISLARHVRDQSAQLLTRDVLKELDSLMAQYIEHNDGRLPGVDLILGDENPTKSVVPDEPTLALAARRNSEEYVRALNSDFRKFRQDGSATLDPFEKLNLPLSVYDLKTVRDAWGSPIVFMPRQHELIGLAPSRAGQDQFFFFSAGPDRNYLTRDDNVYSYETAR